MKSYTDVVFLYMKYHKNKNRLTLICIAISVMLVTAIFSMADISLKTQKQEVINTYGNWHIILSNVSEQTINEVNARKEIAVSGVLGAGVVTEYQGKKLIIQSGSQQFAEQMNLTVKEGRYPISETEALFDQQALKQFDISIGDFIDVTFQNGQTRKYHITGTYNDFSTLKGKDEHGLFLPEGALHFLPESEYKEYNYIQFKKGTNINQTIQQIQSQYHLTENQIVQNVMLVGLMGQSNDSTMINVYRTAIILFALVAVATVFMIASSFNMSILERTQYFGLLRCIGATKRQIKICIRLEGLLYCIKAIPLGLFSGCIVLWLAIWVLKAVNSQYIPSMSFQISLIGIFAGILIGVLVVMIASSSPARNAAKVSPQLAVTGNINQTKHFKKAYPIKKIPVDIAMGISHAFSNKKNIVLISGSFMISIILFLCFTIFITFMNSALKPLKPYAADLSILSNESSVMLPYDLKQQISCLSSVKKVYGRMFYDGISAQYQNYDNMAMLISYDEPQFLWADDMLIEGNIDNVQYGNGVIVDYGYAQQFHWKVGDVITLNVNKTTQNVIISALISDVPFEAENGEWILVCSENTFTKLTDISEYTIIDMQVSQNISEQIRNLITGDMKLLDKQQSNQEIRRSYFAMAVFVYGFLSVIALVAFINIVNTVNTSISSKKNQYGVMRAVGMSCKQIKNMIKVEALTYAATGSIFGTVFGLLLHHLLFEMLITPRWGQIWQPPIFITTLLVFTAMITTLFAAILYSQKIEKTSIVNMISAS